jgi:signal transduction histidine kinase
MNMLLKIWQYLVRPNKAITDVEQRRQSQLLAGVLLGLTLTAVAALSYSVVRDGISEAMVYSWSAVLVSVGIYFLNRSGRFRLAAYIYVGFTFALFYIVPVLIESPGWLLYSNLVVILAAILLPHLTLAVFIVGFVGHIILSLLFPFTLSIDNYTTAIAFVLLGPAILVFVRHRAALEEERQEELWAANEALRASEAALEERVAARTRDLKLASDVARQLTTVLDLKELLPQLVAQTKAAFNLYFVSIFLYQPETQRLTLAAGTGEAGRKMLAEGIGFQLDAKPSLVAKAARERQSVVVNDVTQTEAHAQNPNLPDTKSEAVFPMLVGDELIGVLGTQSEIGNRFGPDDVEIFNILAEQIAIAVKNAQLFEAQVELADELRKADETKSQFLASMSHELRTPLNAIINFTEMISLEMMGPVNEDQKGLLNQTLDSSQHLLNLINDVLDISKIQAGRLALYVEDDVDLQTELNSAVAMVEPILLNKPVRLVQDVDDTLPPMSGDRRRIRQIILNLLTNAAKFTDEGCITLSIKRQDGHILLTVADTGPGISAEMQSFIFEPFIQTEDGLKHAGGSGLGLPITRSLVEAHGGRLWLESEPDVGAAFFVTLPVRTAERV